MVEHLVANQMTRVRFPVPAPGVSKEKRRITGVFLRAESNNTYFFAGGVTIVVEAGFAGGVTIMFGVEFFFSWMRSSCVTRG